MDEFENISALIADLRRQTFKHFQVICCVNQPDSWWNGKEKLHVCESNRKTIALLKEVQDLDLKVIDKSSKGNGWQGKHFGVGWARKTAMDAASEMAGPKDLIITMDGDTNYPADYLYLIQEDFNRNPQIKALTAQYFHKLTGKADEDHAMLRYEIYMRYFAINMMRIGNPYAFTAIGSAMACTASAYRGIRGITPHKSGEDFYFIQKLRKYGGVKISSPAIAYPAARFSDRVFFGTGPAMIRGNSGDWSAYPIYHFRLFEQVKETFDNFPKLYQADLELPMSGFLNEKFGKSIWNDLRKNSKSVESFIRACWHKVDGLRILQFLKSEQQKINATDEANLVEFLKRFYPDEIVTTTLTKSNWSFKGASIDRLDEIRNFLFEKENLWRKQVNILR
jgi:glycosyltransferase involved in cell wall biosynthesis